uniref:Uncharacterized protein n=1 Tax=viral metagenome TaxID=1070528 RepID=A0A6M3JZC7_9ZZZZ
MFALGGKTPKITHINFEIPHSKDENRRIDSYYEPIEARTESELRNDSKLKIFRSHWDGMGAGDLIFPQSYDMMGHKLRVLKKEVENVE